MVLFVQALDPDHTDEAEYAGLIIRFGFPALCVILALFCLLTNNKNQTSYSLWHLISFVQFIRWLPLINNKRPDLYIAFFSQVSKSFNEFQILKSEENESEKSQFSEMGIQGTLFWNNSEQTLFVLLLSLLLFVIVNIGGLFNSNILKWKGFVNYNLIIRTFLVVYLDVLLFSILQLKHLTFESWIPAFNGILAIFFLTSCILGILSMPKLAQRSFERDDLFQQRNTLLEQFRNLDLRSYKYYFMYMIIRLVFCVTYIVLTEDVISQFVIVILTQSIMIWYQIKLRPFKNLVDNIVVISNQTIVLMLILSQIVLHFDLNDDLSVIFSWVSIGLVYLGFSFCLIRVVYAMGLFRKSKVENFNLSVEIKEEDQTKIEHTEMNISKIEISQGFHEIDRNLYPESSPIKTRVIQRKQSFFKHKIYNFQEQNKVSSNPHTKRLLQSQTGLLQNVNLELQSLGSIQERNYQSLQSEQISSRVSSRFTEKPSPIQEQSKEEKIWSQKQIDNSQYILNQINNKYSLNSLQHNQEENSSSLDRYDLNLENNEGQEIMREIQPLGDQQQFFKKKTIQIEDSPVIIQQKKGNLVEDIPDSRQSSSQSPTQKMNKDIFARLSLFQKLNR